ncbi:DUF4145 domain-containing protein [Amycolatopsis sp. cmx-4-83]|uniref:DUF4145 domain-containing protein n=1 Tax=Amycolatopsis sp. cmx-4-83 TaxID=2790940 RepID=UPI0039796A64
MRGETNFGHLTTIDRKLARLGISADNFVVNEPNASMVKARQFVERMTQLLWQRTDLGAGDRPLHQRITVLEDKGVLDSEISALCHKVRLGGNRAVHEFDESRAEAFDLVRVCHKLGDWLESTLNADYQPKPYTPPSPQELGYAKVDKAGAYCLADLTFPARRPHLVFSFGGSYPPAGRSWRYTEQRLRELQDEGRIAVSQSGRPALKRYFHETYPS